MTNRLKATMISDALAPAERLGSSSLAKDLEAQGMTPASMTAAAEKLQELRTRADVAKSAFAEAIAELAKVTKEFVTMWASYSNLIRGLTTDVALRAAHGGSTPGRTKRPRFHRASPPAPPRRPTACRRRTRDRIREEVARMQGHTSRRIGPPGRRLELFRGELRRARSRCGRRSACALRGRARAS